MKNLLVVAAIIHKGSKILIAKRKNSNLGGKWEFPGGKIEEGEEPEEAIKREIREELGIEIEVGDVAAIICEKEEMVNIILLYYHCYYLRGTPQPIDCQEIYWLSTHDIIEIDFAPADLRMYKKLLRKK